MTRQQIGQAIKTARTEQKITQAALAKLAGVSHVRIIDIEQARNSYHIDTLLKVSTALNLSITLTQ